MTLEDDMEQLNAVEEIVKSYILDEFLPDEDPEQLTRTTPLVTNGIIDSLATLKLVAFLEERFSIHVEAHEADTENLDSIERIARLVETKLQPA
jgi:acyl carrier protein